MLLKAPTLELGSETNYLEAIPFARESTMRKTSRTLPPRRHLWSAGCRLPQSLPTIITRWVRHNPTRIIGLVYMKVSRHHPQISNQWQGILMTCQTIVLEQADLGGSRWCSHIARHKTT